MTAARPRVLVVEDEQPLRELIVVTLSEEFDCDEAADGEAALERLRAARPELVVLDGAMDAGANSFLGKPFRVEELVGVAHELAERSR